MSRLESAEQRIDELGNFNDFPIIWLTLSLVLCGVALINKRLLGHMFLLGSIFLWMWMIIRHTYIIDATQQYLVEGSISTDAAMPKVVLFIVSKANKLFRWYLADAVEGM